MTRPTVLYHTMQEATDCEMVMCGRIRVPYLTLIRLIFIQDSLNYVTVSIQFSFTVMTNVKYFDCDDVILQYIDSPGYRCKNKMLYCYSYCYGYDMTKQTTALDAAPAPAPDSGSDCSNLFGGIIGFGFGHGTNCQQLKLRAGSLLSYLLVQTFTARKSKFQLISNSAKSSICYFVHSLNKGLYLK
jgi:hypothetical protein